MKIWTLERNGGSGMAVLSTNSSAEVRLMLRFAGRCLRPGQITPDAVCCDPPVELPPGEGEVVMTVDGQARTRAVLLPVGSKADQPRTPIRRL